MSCLFSLFRTVTVSVLIGGMAFALVACGSGQGNDVEVVQPRLIQTANGNRSFTGTLVNNGTTPLPIAEIEVALYDESGNPVETVRIEVNEIPGRDSVQFRQRIDSDLPFSQAQVKSVLTP